MIKKSLKGLSLGILIMISALFCGCEQSSISEDDNAVTKNGLQTRSLFTDTIDWENKTTFDMVDAQGNKIKNVPLPWSPGLSSDIPADWIDQQLYNSDISQRMYTRQKHWTMLYTNVQEVTNSKYIIMYNIYTGIMRCFFYLNGSSAYGGTTNSVWGIVLNNVSSSIFNFGGTFAKSIADTEYNPSIASTNQNGNSNNGTFSSGGFDNNIWYGFQMECAYDPNLCTTPNSNATFTFCGNAIDKITYNGTGNTTGSLDGSITAIGSNKGGLTLNFSNMLNSGSIFNVNNAAKSVGDAIDSKAKNSSFFGSLLSSIEKAVPQAIESGASKGLSALVSEGGSIAASVLGKLFSSFIGGSTPTASSVNLTAKLQSSYSFSSTQTFPGWNNAQSIPIPGLIPSADNPLYNEPLGVWNLAEDPKISNVISGTDYYIAESKVYYKTTYSSNYVLYGSTPLVILNPIISKNFKIVNAQQEMVADSLQAGINITRFEPYAFMNNNYYYLIGNSTGNGETYTSWDGPRTFDYINCDNGSSNSNILVRVSFDLVNTNTNDTIYISKYFYPSFSIVTGHFSKKYVKSSDVGPIN